MERKQYLYQIKKLVLTVQMLLDANLTLGNKQKEQKTKSDRKIPICRLRLTSLQENCKLMAKAPLDFFRGFFDMIVAGRRDYALMTKALLVKPV